jgi:hypothetical protein
VSYKRARHKAIAIVLGALDGQKLREQNCFFGGGTAIAMTCGEYRTSFDIDFLVSEENGYRSLRNEVKQFGLKSLLRQEFQEVIFATPARVDQYGIRGEFILADLALKFEIISEGRIVLNSQADQVTIHGITLLTQEDLVAEKLLANSDRFADSGTFMRDLIDLAFMDLPQLRKHPGFTKAVKAYGDSLERDLDSALKKLSEDKSWLGRCMEQLEIEVAPAVLMQKLSALSR